MVVVGRPALPEERVGTASVALVEKGLAVDLCASHVDAEVVLPLQPQVGADRLVERVAVVDVGETFHLRARRVPSLVLRPRGRGVEPDVGVYAVAEVTGKTTADHSTGRLDAGGPQVAHRLFERLAVDRLAEGV